MTAIRDAGPTKLPAVDDVAVDEPDVGGAGAERVADVPPPHPPINTIRPPATIHVTFRTRHSVRRLARSMPLDAIR